MKLSNKFHAISDLTSLSVENIEGQDLGKIKDIVIDVSTGRISYAVLSFGGFLGIGDKYFAIPWNKLQYSQVEEKFTLPMSKEELKKAEGFDKENWPKLHEPEYSTRIHSFYDTTPNTLSM